LESPPDKLEFEEIIKRSGTTEALQLAKNFYQLDSTADLLVKCSKPTGPGFWEKK
jgi:hypothetical protein